MRIFVILFLLLTVGFNANAQNIEFNPTEYSFCVEVLGQQKNLHLVYTAETETTWFLELSLHPEGLDPTWTMELNKKMAWEINHPLDNFEYTEKSNYYFVGKGDFQEWTPESRMLRPHSGNIFGILQDAKGDEIHFYCIEKGYEVPTSVIRATKN